MKKLSFIISTAIAILLIFSNMSLLLKSDSKINRLSFLTEWGKVKQEDMAKTLPAEGVVKPAETHAVYFNDQHAISQEFLVKKGDEVTVGTPLFTYIASDIAAEKARLETEKHNIQNKMQSIEEHIEKLKNSLTNMETETKLDSGNLHVVTYSLEQAIYAKQLEVSLLQNELETFDEQIATLNNSEPELTIYSDVNGTIKEINENLTNPLITINSDVLTVEGLLAEKDVHKVSPGMRSFLSLQQQNEQFNGEVTAVQNFPDEEPTIGQASLYPFTVSFAEPGETDSIRTGAHVNIDVVLEEANGVLTVPAKSIENGKEEQFLYVISPNGTVVKQVVETGLKVNGRQEVRFGVDKNTLFIVDPNQVNSTDHSFFTPIKTSHIEKEAFLGLTKKQMLKYVLYGFLH